MLNKFIKWLTIKLITYCERNNKVVDIMDRDKNGNMKPELYLRRYMVFFSRFGCIYIHRFFKSDDETHHDHPWNFFTYVVEGGYKEELLKSTNYDKFNVWPAHFETSQTERKPGSIAYRQAKDIHRVILPRSYSPEEEQLTPLTICLIGPRIREWGFWKNIPDTKNFKKWRIWTEFLGIDPYNKDFKGHS